MVSLIVAVDNTFGISRGNKIVWNYKEDYNYFIDVTSRIYKEGKNVLIMGKNTWLTLPKQLPNRITIVVSTTLQLETNDSLFIVKSLSEALELTKTIVCGRVFICGGKALYEESLPFVDSIFLTMIHHDYDCDNVISLPLNHYKTHKKHTFELVDKMTEEKHFVSFHKLYLDELPAFWVIQKEEQQYLDLLEKILTKNNFHTSRNSNTWSVFGKTLKFDLSKHFPLLTTKKMFTFGIFEELLFFLRGQTDSNILSKKGVHIWEGNTSREFLDSVGLHHYKPGDIGGIYSHCLKYYGAEYKGMDHDYTGQGIDQIEKCIQLLMTDPYSRRILMTTYNPSQTHTGVLVVCHGLVVQYNVKLYNNQYILNCAMYQRSADTLLGIPFNLSSYAMLTYLLCNTINNNETYLGLKFTPGKLVMFLGDCHAYESHREQVIRQILRDPFKFPTLEINKKAKHITDFEFTDLMINNYLSYGAISAKMVA
jgi:dihydrofolate reductase/thymidylate synthase